MFFYPVFVLCIFKKINLFSLIFSKLGNILNFLFGFGVTAALYLPYKFLNKQLKTKQHENN